VRGPFEGVLNVCGLLAGVLVGAGIALGAAVLGAFSHPLQPWFRAICSLVGGGAAIYLLTSSLIVSHVILRSSPLCIVQWAGRWAGDSAAEL